MLLVWTCSGGVHKNVLPFTAIKLYPKMLLESMASGLCKQVLSLTCRSLVKEHSVLFSWSPLSLENLLFLSIFPVLLTVSDFLYIFAFLLVLITRIFFCSCKSNLICPFLRKNPKFQRSNPSRLHNASMGWIGIFQSRTSGNCGG